MSAHADSDFYLDYPVTVIFFWVSSIKYHYGQESIPHNQATPQLLGKVASQKQHINHEHLIHLILLILLSKKIKIT